ncbi:alpha/beta hydrolase family protein [Pseudomonas citronellolis]|uniref:alpha/beta hydrolase family protein n=1 Tax=Pseudomonas citronellolis TaxID=53408 RepID=UPI0023E3CBEC|nr:alpha/beta hydrolase family protein [Pseudomonas citronellolis]MDF3935485.1 alpha/beta hydrolase family protein [Pseudomonas citronellolis]
MPRPAQPTRLALCLALSLAPLAPLLAEETPASPPGPAVAPATPARPDLEERSQDESKSLQQRLPEKQQQTLQAGDESFLALWLPANAPQAEGVVIIVPGDGENPDWPVAVGPLRRKLPDAGWQTLALSLPDPQDSQPLPRKESPDKAAADSDAGASSKDVKGQAGAATPTPESTAEAGSAEPAQASGEAPPAPDPAIERRKAYADRVMARIQAGLDFALQDKPKSVILVGHGTGAYWAARYLAEREPGDIHNLLLVGAELPRDFRPALEDMVPRLPLAVGDFYYRDRRDDRDAAKARLQASKRETGKTYVQIAMNALPADRATEQDQLYRRIRGWLSLHLKAAQAE